MKVNLSEKSKAEFIDHISKQSINCWFEGDEFVMPCGQGKASKGIVLYQLSVWQLKQDEIEEKDKRIEALITTWRNQTKELCNVDDKHVREALLSCADELEVMRANNANS